MNKNRACAGAIFAIGAVSMALCSPSASAQNLEISGPGVSASFTLQDLKANVTSHEVAIEDVEYNKRKVFDAFRLRDVLTLANVHQNSRSVLLFKTLDGYTTHLASASVTNEAYLTYQDHESTGTFELIKKGGYYVDPGPYYLVWTVEASHDLPRPYQIIEIEVLPDPASLFANLEPGKSASSSVRRGFQLFKSHCMSCHAINQVGGRVGPELNVPRNVTEYFDGAVLRRYIRRPESVRYGAKMPAFDEERLSDADIEALLSYLKAMKRRKMETAP